MGHFTVIGAATPALDILSAPVAIQQRTHKIIQTSILLPHRSITILHCTTDTSAAWAAPRIAELGIVTTIRHCSRKMPQSQ